MIDDPEAYARSLLSIPAIINLTGDKTVHYIHAIMPRTPYIEYEFINEEGGLYEEGQEKDSIYYLQVDVFTNAEKDTHFKSLAKVIKDTLLNAGLQKDIIQDLYEPETKYYHKVLRFNFAG